MATDNPFPLPASLGSDLARVFNYWRGLKRGGNDMPFWDDVKLSALPDLADTLVLVDVFAAPERFRLNTVGKKFGDPSLHGKFIDETEFAGGLAFLRAQASATVEARAPTYYRGGGFARLLLPMWGDGRIGMLLGGLEPG